MLRISVPKLPLTPSKIFNRISDVSSLPIQHGREASAGICHHTVVVGEISMDNYRPRTWKNILDGSWIDLVELSQKLSHAEEETPGVTMLNEFAAWNTRHVGKTQFAGVTSWQHSGNRKMRQAGKNSVLAVVADEVCVMPLDDG